MNDTLKGNRLRLRHNAATDDLQFELNGVAVDGILGYEVKAAAGEPPVLVLECCLGAVEAAFGEAVH